MKKIPRITFPNPTTLTPVQQQLINSREKDRGEVRTAIPRQEMLEDLYKTSLPAKGDSIDSFITTLHDQTLDNIKEANKYLHSIKDPDIMKDPTGQAFNNCYGSWCEYAFAAFAWNKLAEMNRGRKKEAQQNPFSEYIYVKLPNRNSESNDWINLLPSDIMEGLMAFPDSKKSNLSDESSQNYNRDFLIISSNPDAVIIKLKSDSLPANLPLDPLEEINSLNVETLKALDKLFELFEGLVLPSKNLQCFISIKHSTRPDRRYQWVHEADRVKTILEWIVARPYDPDLKYNNLNGKYFAVSLKPCSTSDYSAMNAGYSASITQPLLDPMWAVDKLYECTKFSNIEGRIEEMIKFK